MVGVLVRVSSQEMMMFVLLRQMIELFDGDDTQLGIYESTLQKLACKLQMSVVEELEPKKQLSV